MSQFFVEFLESYYLLLLFSLENRVYLIVSIPDLCNLITLVLDCIDS